MPGGRPSKYKEEYCEQLISHMSEGKAIESFCGGISISKPTFYSWCDKFPEFLNAKKIGEMKSFAWWELQAMTYMHLPHQGGSFNVACWIFNMRNRFGWRDKQLEPETEKDNIVHRDSDDAKL